MSKDHNTITCTHGKGLACPVCYDQTHSLENSEFVVDPFDTYEEHELPPKPVRDIPKYMFAERPVTPSTWMELQEMQLDTYMLADRTALLVDPVTREYCYVFWDEAEQCSNPYPTHDAALAAVFAYQP